MAKKKRYYEANGVGMGSSMMPSGIGQQANMPQKSFSKFYPKVGYINTPAYPDKMSDMQRQMANDIVKVSRDSSNKKY